MRLQGRCIMSKHIKKSIETTLEVKLMSGRTVRDLYIDFFGGRLPKDLDGREVITTVMLDNEYVPYSLYRKFSGHGASKEFLDDFVFNYEVRNKVITDTRLKEEVLKVVPFDEPDSITSGLHSYTLGANILGRGGSFKIRIETYSWKENITEEQIKKVNKDNARRLRKYLVKLQSVQGVPYDCSYREDEIEEKQCEI